MVASTHRRTERGRGIPIENAVLRSSFNGYGLRAMPDLPTNSQPGDDIHRVTELVAKQAGVSMPRARQLLIAMSNEIGESLEHTALDVLDGIIRFDE